MTISKRQFDLLNVMNIPLWVTKQSTITSVEKEVTTVEEAEVGISEIGSSKIESAEIKNTQNIIEYSITSIDLPSLANTPLFNDILLTLGLSVAEASIETSAETNEENNVETNIVNLGLISWQFSSTKTLAFVNNVLTTPTIEQLEKSSNLKRQLWQLLVKNELICR